MDNKEYNSNEQLYFSLLDRVEGETELYTDDNPTLEAKVKGKMVLRNVADNVRGLLKNTGLDKRITIE
ncbi:MAG: hypothetical protein K6F55_02810 [Eubacterium sp.]|nr:hypothetical protein [Eubacterium sp.]